MKSDGKNNLIKTQIAIILTLLDGSAKSQRQIARKIKKGDSTVSKALVYLKNVIETEEKEIESGSRNKGIYKNKLCRLTYNIENGKYVLNFLREISNSGNLKGHYIREYIGTLSKNDKILEMLVKNHFWLIDYETWKADLTPNPAHRMCNACISHLNKPPLCKFDEHQRKKCLELLKNPKQFSLRLDADKDAFFIEIKEGLKNYAESIRDELTNKFKSRLKISPYFFKICLTKTPEELKRQFKHVYELTLDAHLKKHPFNIMSNGDEPEAILNAYFDKIFEISVFYDILNGNVSEEAVRYISEMNRHKAKVLEDIENLDVITYFEHPEELQWKYKEIITKPLYSKFEIDFQKVKQNRKLNKKSELVKFLKENKFSVEEIALSHLIVGGLFRGKERMRLKDILSALNKIDTPYPETLIINTLEKLRKTKRKDGNNNPVMNTIGLGTRWYCLPTFTKDFSKNKRHKQIT